MFSFDPNGDCKFNFEGVFTLSGLADSDLDRDLE